MAKVLLLSIENRVVGPHLQLLRQVCEPSSRSRPHITIRYFDKLRITEEYRNAQAPYIDLVEPGMFRQQANGSSPPSVRARGAVFIRCKSDELAALEHKPHFPSSDFHITIYDGPSPSFARKVLRELQRYPWRIRVPLPGRAALQVKDLSRPAKQRTREEPDYGVDASELFHRITSRKLTGSCLLNLTSIERLRLCRSILNSLFRATRHFQRVPAMGRPSVSRQHLRSDVPELPEVHLTPPELAREIAAYAVDEMEPRDGPIHFGDPAVGTGAFFGALLQLVPRQRIKSAIGIDINVEQAAAAQWRWADKGMDVWNADYLHMEELPRRTLVLANPPYLRHQSIPANYKRQLLQRASLRTKIQISARSGLYVYFLLLSHDWMAEGAVAAWLIPSEFMRSVYGSAIREYLTNNVELLRLHVFHQNVPQFETVVVAPAVIVFRNRKTSSEHAVRVTAGGSLRNPDVNQTILLDDLRKADTWTVPFFQRTADSEQLRIRDLFSVRRGIATGANEFFIMTRTRAAELGIPKCALRPLLPKERTLTADIIEADDEGYPKVSLQLCVIDCDLSEKQIAKRYPKLMRYLKTAKSSGILNRYLLRHRHPWYKQEVRTPPRFLCTYMGRGSDRKPPLRFIWNKSVAVATNTYLLLYPNRVLADIVSHRPNAEAELFSALQRAAETEVRERARVYAGGLLKIEPRELGDVRLTLSGVLGGENIQPQLSLFSRSIQVPASRSY